MEFSRPVTYAIAFSMKSFLFKWLTVAFAIALLGSMVSMMAAFVGSRGDDLRQLLILQMALVPLAVLVIVWCFAGLFRQYGFRKTGSLFWNHLPGWLLFGVLAANSLVMIAELTFLLLQHYTGRLRPWQEHVPAVMALTSSIAVATCYVCWHLTDSGRESNNQ